MTRSFALVVLGVVGAVGCAHSVPPETPVEAVRSASPAPHGKLAYRGFVGKPVTVVVVDRDGSFIGYPKGLAVAREAIGQELREAGAQVVAESERRLMVEVSATTAPDLGASPPCVRVDARLELASSAFLPQQNVTASRCAGVAFPASGPSDPVGALLSVAALAAHEASGAGSRDRVEAMFWALDAVMVELDAKVK